MPYRNTGHLPRLYSNYHRFLLNILFLPVYLFSLIIHFLFTARAQKAQEKCRHDDASLAMPSIWASTYSIYRAFPAAHDGDEPQALGPETDSQFLSRDASLNY